MADLIYFHGVVRGPKNACQAFFGALPKTDDPIWREVRKDGNEYFVAFECEHKAMSWKTYQSGKKLTQKTIPADSCDAFHFGEKYFGEPPADISKVFGVAFVVWDDWENYYAFDHGEKLSGPLADELKQEFVSPSESLYRYTDEDLEKRFGELKLDLVQPNEQEIAAIIDCAFKTLERFPFTLGGLSYMFWKYPVEVSGTECLLPGDQIVFKSNWQIDEGNPDISFFMECVDGRKFGEWKAELISQPKELAYFLPAAEIIGDLIDDESDNVPYYSKTPEDLTQEEIYRAVSLSCLLPYTFATVYQIKPASLRSKQYDYPLIEVKLNLLPFKADEMADSIRKLLAIPIQDRSTSSTIRKD